MKIGEFAKACHTNISVLRHYDKIGLLNPIFTDPITEYRYYSVAQVEVFERISEMKSLGFSLAQIKILLNSNELEKRKKIYDNKREELSAMLHNLDEMKEKILGGIDMGDTYTAFVEEFDKTFVNDEKVIGKWEVINKEDAPEKDVTVTLGDGKQLLYFLPEGEAYWCYSWTKGKLIFSDGYSCFSNDYIIEEKENDIYMTIHFKSFDFPTTGETTKIKLRKINSEKYTREDIARKDDMNKPFVNDKQVIGKWKAFAYIDENSNKVKEFMKDPYCLENGCYENLYFKEIIFEEEGHCTQLYGDKTLSGDDLQTWTKGFVLRKWNSCACAYKIFEASGREYMIIEWKSGDYRWGGKSTSYYAFIRA